MDILMIMMMNVIVFAIMVVICDVMLNVIILVQDEVVELL